MRFIRSLMRSFMFAFRGLAYMVVRERNFRIHLVAIFYVMLFAFFYGLDATQWAVLVLTFFSVPTLEAINTAIENTVDVKTREQHPTARIAKDVAAASVLFSSLCAIIVGICLFSDKTKLLLAFQTAFSPPWLIIIFITLFPAFIFIKGGKKDKKNMEQQKNIKNKGNS